MSKYKDLFLTTTDTVVGLGGPVSSQNKKLICELKKRPLSKPLIILVGSLEQAQKLPSWNTEAEKLALTVWPGPVTLVLNSKTAVRQPNSFGLLNLLLEKGPCYVTSANLAGEKPYSLSKAKKVFLEVKQFYNFEKGSKKPSIIIDVKTNKIIRT